jgi:hypothetical protein
MEEYSERAASALEFEQDASIEKSLVGMIRARDLHLTQSAAGPAVVGGNLSILQGGCGPVSRTAASRSARVDAVP